MSNFKYIIVGIAIALSACCLHPSPALSQKPLIFAGDINLPPIESMKDGKPVGVNIDILQALSEAMERPIEIKLRDWSDAQEMVQSGEADALTALVPTPERQKLYDFSEPTLSVQFTLFIKKDNLIIRSIKDAEGKVVGVTRAGYARQVLEPNKKITLRFIKNNREGFRLLANNEIDAVATDTWVGLYTLQEYDIHDITIIDKPFAVNQASIPVKKGNLALLAEINQGINKIKQQGVIAQIEKDWTGEKIVFFPQKFLSHLFFYVAIVCLTLFSMIFFLWNYSLKKQIRTRKQTESKLRHKEEKFRTLFENMVQGVFYQNADGSLVDVNASALAMLGLTRDQFLGRDSYDPAWKVINEDGSDLPVDEHPSMAALRTGKPVLNKTLAVFNPKTAEYTWLVLNAIPQYEEGSEKPSHVFVTMHDITPKKHIEEKLIESEEKFRSITANSPDFIFILDHGANIKFINRTITGRPADEVIGTNLYGHLVKKDRMAIEKALCQVVQTGKADNFEIPTTTPDSVMRIFECRIRPIAFQGDKQNLLMNATDITERKKAEEALRQSEKKYRLLTEKARDVVFRTRISDAAYEYISPAAIELFGYEPNEFYENSQLLLEILPQGWDTYFHDKWAEIGDGQRPQSYDFPIIHKRTGEIRWMHQRNDWIDDENGELIALQGRVVDITEQKKAEETLRKSKSELEKRVRERTAELIQKTDNLEEVNAALKILLRESGTLKEEIEEKIRRNIKESVLPYLDEVGAMLKDKDLELYIDTIKSNIDTIASSFTKSLSLDHQDLTPREVQVANFIRQGKTNKDIAHLLKITPSAVDFHRRNLREKLNLKGKKTNLRSHLLKFVG